MHKKRKKIKKEQKIEIKKQNKSHDVLTMSDTIFSDCVWHYFVCKLWYYLHHPGLEIKVSDLLKQDLSGPLYIYIRS